ncbi:helix-turn-helix domain-containing protein [Tenacibaculum sp. M341]|uniref:helix-turn-helix domain-containing protein n=1 Tax=Tenacibaculum sp. M341 TaxID=2530339 RepID=UPI0010448DA3|nr:AraC family transcriptional regulator [Tenacibaculum sp. M341]TCI85835.1 AraC family transcriptional regulator [Tenacibaculum sp. M341]
MNLDLRVYIGILATFITLLFAIFVFSVKSENKLSNRLFGIFLILSSIEMSGFFVHDFVPTSLSAIMLKNNNYYLLTPVFYLYVCSVCYSNFKLEKKHLWHLLPFIIGNLVMMPRFYFGNDQVLEEVSKDTIHTWEVIFMHISMHLQSMYYYIMCLVVLKKAKNIFFENHSNNAIQTYKWLYQIVIFWIVIFSLAILKNTFKYLDLGSDAFLNSKVILIFSVLLVTCWYVLKALNNPELFKGVDSQTKLTKDLIEEVKNKSDNEEIIGSLKLFMDEEKPYLNPSLSIRNLAQQMKIPVRELSIAINHDLNQHFFDFVNGYRIEKAKKILSDPSKSKVTVLEILYEVGFNSKSSFNTAFKKYTSLTPTQFRKRELQL